MGTSGGRRVLASLITIYRREVRGEGIDDELPKGIVGDLTAIWLMVSLVGIPLLLGGSTHPALVSSRPQRKPVSPTRPLSASESSTEAMQATGTARAAAPSSRAGRRDG